MSLERNDVSAVVSDSAYYLIPPLTTQLRDMARAATWPDVIVNQMEIQFDGENLFVYYPDSLATEVNKLEYGHGSDRPNSVIRAFTYRVEPTIKRIMGTRTVNAIIDEEDIFNA